MKKCEQCKKEYDSSKGAECPNCGNINTSKEAVKALINFFRNG